MYKSIWINIIIAISIIIGLASCSHQSSSRTSKYSSAKKRSQQRHTTKENDSYTYKNNKKESKASGTSANVSLIRKEIVNSATQLTGTNYRAGGKSPETGFDCSGFTGYIFTQNGYKISGPSHQLATLGKPKSQKELMPGDLIFFGNADRISHVAIVSDHTDDQLKVVHATTSAGVKEDEISKSEYWQTRFLFGRDLLSK